MIQGFFDNLPRDFSLAIDNNSPFFPEATDKNQKNILSGMACAKLGARIVVVCSAVCASAVTSGSFIPLAVAVALYVVAHDLFKMAQNAENHQNLWTTTGTLAKATARWTWSWITWEKDADKKSIITDLTNGTFLQQMWIQIFTMIDAAREQRQ